MSIITAGLLAFVVGIYLTILVLGGFFLLYHPWDLDGLPRHPLLCRITTATMFIAAIDIAGWVTWCFLKATHTLEFTSYHPYGLYALDGIYFCALTFIGEVLIDPHKPNWKVMYSYAIPTVIVIAVLVFVRTTWMIYVSYSAMCIYLLGILIHQFVLISRREKAVKEHYSEIERHSYQWFFKVVGLFVVQLILYAVVITHAHIVPFIIFDAFSFAMWLYILVCVIQVVPDTYRLDQQDTQETETETETVPDNVEDNTLKITNIGPIKTEPVWVTNLNTIMREQHPFTDSDLNITTLAHLVGTNRTYLSSYITKKLNMSFYTYINNYRLEYLTELIKKSDPSIKLETMALESGFTSDRAMRKAFLTRYKCLPNEYRTKVLSEQKDI